MKYFCHTYMQSIYVMASYRIVCGLGPIMHEIAMCWNVFVVRLAEWCIRTHLAIVYNDYCAHCKFLAMPAVY